MKSSFTRDTGPGSHDAGSLIFRLDGSVALARVPSVGGSYLMYTRMLAVFRRAARG